MEEHQRAINRQAQLGLTLLIMVLWADFSGSLVIFPELVRLYQYNLFVGPRFISIFYFGLALSLPFSKYFLKSFSIKKILIIGLILYAAGALLMLLPINSLCLIGLRCGQGIGAGIMFSAVYASRHYLNLDYGHKLSIYSMIGLAFGPALATLLIYLTAAWPFFYICLALMNLAFIGIVIKYYPTLYANIESKKNNVYTRLLVYIAFLVSLILIIEFAYNPLISQSYVIFCVFIAISSAVYLYTQEKDFDTAVIITKDLRSLKSSDFYIIAFITGFFLLPFLMLEMIHFMMVHGDTLLHVGMIMFISTLVIAIFSFISRLISVKINHLKVLLVAIIFLEIALLLQFTIDRNSMPSEIFFSVIVFNASFGMILGAGAWHRHELNLKSTSSSYASTYVMLFSVGTLLGINVFLRTFFNRVIYNSTYEINAELTILPEKFAHYAQTMPLIFDKYRTEIITHDTNVSTIVNKLHAIYVDALIKTMHHGVLIMALIAFISLLFIIYHLNHSEKVD